MAKQAVAVNAPACVHYYTKCHSMHMPNEKLHAQATPKSFRKSCRERGGGRVCSHAAMLYVDLTYMVR